MDSGVVRDLVICITGGLQLILLILVGILVILLYRQISKLSKRTKDTIQDVKEMGAEVKEAIKSSKAIFTQFKNPTTDKSEPSGNTKTDI